MQRHQSSLSLQPAPLLAADQHYRDVLHDKALQSEPWFLELLASQAAIIADCTYALANHGANFKSLLGSAQRGEQIFRSHAGAQCIRCHTPAADAHSLGPQLKDLSRRMSRSEILQSIVEPSARIHPDFRSVIVTLDDGRRLEGRLRGVPDEPSARTQAFEIIDREAVRHQIAPEAVESISSPRSPRV